MLDGWSIAFNPSSIRIDQIKTLLISKYYESLTWPNPLSKPLTSLSLKKIVISSNFSFDENFPSDNVTKRLRTTIFFE